jgi:hypothetical protein
MVLCAIFETRIFAAYPRFCPLARHLPAEGVATRCYMSGGIDIQDNFEARMSEAGATAYQRGLLGSLKNPRIIDGSGLNARFEADGDILVGFSWENSVLTVDYLNY